MKENIIYETLKQYHISLDQIDITVHARISRIINPEGEHEYEWSVSHYCKPSEEALGAYIPSIQCGKNFIDVEVLLLAYLKSFSGIGVVKNINF
jgi:hypothetical protein